MASHNELGEKGEELAVQHLIKSGYQIRERNWRYGKEEIDIIATIGDELAIVEVKTRNSDFFGEPQEFVSKAKQNHMIRAANAYVEKHDIDLEVRFDVIGIIINSKGTKIDHIEGAFQPRW
ncbi:MAG: YraN family protein [Flavobacteriales bacterium]